TISPLAMQKGLSLDCQLAPELYAVVRCDDNRLRQILVNLLDNAMKFTDKGGITIVGQQAALTENRARIRFSVIDTGEGIPEARRPRMFKAFSQVDSSTTRRFGGTGLGLSICRQLVDLMGGEIGVDSQVGIGSTFWFEIPVDIVRPASQAFQIPAAKTPLELASGKPSPLLNTISGHILVAEDNHINQLYISELLKHLGCTYVVVSNGEEAIASLDLTRFDLILMDCQMPEMDGFAASREIRKREVAETVGRRIPIVALTANALKGDCERCLDAGMDEYLSKPVQVAQLLNVLKTYLERKAE
ncbi:MAG TPA: ATP-binding protein, partial [Pirellula sp.]|nr:ATP-binding protein [Pirellula sp.]